MCENNDDFGFFEDDVNEEYGITFSIHRDKPLGMTWSEDKMVNFLSSIGYLIFEREDDYSDTKIKVAVKKDSTLVPETESNIAEVFNSEIQDRFLKLLKDI